MSVFKETRQLWLDDVTDSVGQAFLAQAMQCAKCHDHNDPVPTRRIVAARWLSFRRPLAERKAYFSPRIQGRL